LNANHDVLNQPVPFVDHDLLAVNRPLQDALKAFLPADRHDATRAALHALGTEAGSAALQRHARLANTHPPELHTHTVQGHRSDTVEFHPSYHVLLGGALRHGLHGSPWAAPSVIDRSVIDHSVRDRSAPGAHLHRAAGFTLWTEAEPSVLCPVSMTYAVAPSLRGNPALQALWGPKLAARDYDERFVPGHLKSTVTMGMGMTEKQGGSDVRANTTAATADGADAWGERAVITGHKWFFSAPMCDAFLVLAQAPEGLTCYFVPRFRPDGTLNALRLQRLKDKLGNHANASSEVEFDRASAWRVGEPGRGVPQILAMGALTRLDCALGTAGLMRQALSLALHHAAQRHAFGRPLIEQPLMREVLADLALESEAATWLALRLAAAVDRTESGQDPSGFEALLRRVLTPIAKFWVCKRGSGFAQEAMECLGGNGYVEAGGQVAMARIYREMPLNSIWEGAGNIQSLDLLRALRTGVRSPTGGDGPGTHRTVADALMTLTAGARAAHPAAARTGEAVARQLDGDADEAGARQLARDVALLVQAALLHANAAQTEAGDDLFRCFCDSRLSQASDVYGTLGARAPLDALLRRAMPWKV
jgi:putative acyl-CoA dehydrogenase